MLHTCSSLLWTLVELYSIHLSLVDTTKHSVGTPNTYNIVCIIIRVSSSVCAACMHALPTKSILTAVSFSLIDYKYTICLSLINLPQCKEHDIVSHNHNIFVCNQL